MNRLVALGLALLAPVPAFAQNVAATVDRVARDQIEKQQLVGLAVGVVLDGKIAYLQGYGFADWEAKRPVDPFATQFRWASCSKSVTAIAAMQLVEAGTLNLDRDVREYVPEFPDKGTPITVRQLLCHQSGIVHYSNGKVVPTVRTYDADHPFDDVISALDTFKESPLVGKPGEKFSYTTHGYILLSAVIQRAGKERFEDQVRDRIATPLGMATFQPDREWKDIPNRAAGYQKSSNAIFRRPAARAPDVSWKLGGGGYTSTVEDFAKFAAGLSSRKLVKPATETTMWTDRTPADPRGGRPYGLGFALGKTPAGQEFVGHGGAQEKTRTMMMLDPKTRRAVVVMTNSEWANPSVVAAAVLDAIAASDSAKSRSGANE